MKYVEFEIELQELLDERRFHEVDRLLAQVDAEDRPRCERLAADYGMLFDGLESWNQPTSSGALTDRILAELQTASPALPIAAERPDDYAAATPWLPIAAMAMAASLLILAFIPFSLSQRGDDRVGAYVATNDPDNLDLDDQPLEQLDWEDAQYVSTVRSPFDLPWDLTNDLVGVTTAPRLPLDSSALAVSSLDASPWIDTVQNPLRPLTQSMGTALMVIKEVTIPSAADRNADPEAKPQARGWKLPLSIGRRIT
ncbi:hypothetical protein LOC68_21140 [Blastopirellula sp. JC732]|uniref:Uncharacterized protein n=1 Tax=Blastopirellula sediminis TaxID=2894196 RepID=A0A9X1MSN8_9BACT|nr:hypothetical protein [Blastopirellula sediminis]MCC9605796.1 hypothetical protein [Blastopirellula sediminis]MCC9630904.1 hypothetical protein [Blastopirellula sediminis]